MINQHKDKSLYPNYISNAFRENDEEILQFLKTNQKNSKNSIYQDFELLGKAQYKVQVIWDKDSDKLYAVKVHDLEGDLPKFRRFIREIRMMKEINYLESDKFLKLHDYFIHSETHSENKKIKFSLRVVMDMCDGDLWTYHNFLIDMITKAEKKQKLKIEERNIIFFNFLKIFKEVLEILKFLKKNFYVHSDFKLRNFLLLLNDSGSFSIKCADFGGLISYEEHCEIKSFFEYTHIHKEIYQKAAQKEALTLDDFFKVDVYAAGCLLMELLQISPFMTAQNKERCKYIETEIINPMINGEKLENITHLEEVEEKFEAFMKKENINLDKKIIIINRKLLMKIKGKLQENYQLIYKYYNIGCYSRPSFLLLKQKKLDPLFRLGCIHNLMRNEELSLKYYNQYEKKLEKEEDSLEKTQKITFLKSQKASIYSSLSNEENLIEYLSFLKENIKIEECDILSYYIQQSITNFVFILIDKFELKEASSFLEKLYLRLDQEKIAPNFNKKFGEEDINNLNHFFSNIYNSHSILEGRINVSTKKPLELIKKSLKLMKTFYAKNTVNMARIRNNCGIAFLNDKKYEKAYSCFEKSYNIRKKLQEKSSKAVPINTSFVLIPFHNMSWTKIALGQYEQAFESALEIYNKRLVVYENNYHNRDFICSEFLLAICSLLLGKPEAKEKIKKIKSDIKENQSLWAGFKYEINLYLKEEIILKYGDLLSF